MRYKSIKTQVLSEKQMQRLGMGSLLSVSAGSAEEAWRPFSRGKETTLAMSRRLVDVLAPRVDARLGQALLDTMSELEQLVRGLVGLCPARG